MIVRPCAFSEWLKPLTGLPVRMSYAKMFCAAISPVPPAATPGGRALVKLPVTYTVLPTSTWLQATPLICHVGKASALTVAGVPVAGAVSA